MNQVLATAFEILAPALAGALAWATVWLTGVIRAKVKNDVAAGILARLTESVASAVGAVGQQTTELIGQARFVGSDGGRKLTKQEAALLREAALGIVKDFWGPKGLAELAKILTPGERGGARVDSIIRARIEAAVGEAKRRPASSITTPVPVTKDRTMV